MLGTLLGKFLLFALAIDVVKNFTSPFLGRASVNDIEDVALRIGFKGL